MAITIKPILRKFKLGMQLLDDPAPGQPIDTAIQILSIAHPEISTASMNEPLIKDGAQVYNFERSIGTKG